MALFSGQVGPQLITADSGTASNVRQDRSGALVVGAARAPFAEQTFRGVVYAASIPPGTGQAHGTAIGTTGAFVLGNPSGSGTNLVILQINAGYISGTLGAGVIALLAHNTAPPITAPSGGTAITPQPMLLPASTTAIANCRFNATVPATGLMIRAIGNLLPMLATTAAAPWQIVDRVDGAVIVGPGSAVSIQSIATAGTSPLMTFGMVWAEESSVSQ